MNANMSEMTDQIAFRGKSFCNLNKHNCCVAIGRDCANFKHTELGKSIMVSQNSERKVDFFAMFYHHIEKLRDLSQEEHLYGNVNGIYYKLFMCSANDGVSPANSMLSHSVLNRRAEVPY